MGNKSKNKNKNKNEKKLKLKKVETLKPIPVLTPESFKARKKLLLKHIELFQALKEVQKNCYIIPEENKKEDERQLEICSKALKTLKKVENEETLIQVERYVNSIFPEETILGIQAYGYTITYSCQPETQILELDAEITHKKAQEFFKAQEENPELPKNDKVLEEEK